jgi:hypothetical protein
VTHHRTRARTAAGLSGILLAAASAGIAAADAYYRPAPSPSSVPPAAAPPTTGNAAGDDDGTIEPTIKCGIERWDVKTGTDPNASNVDQASVEKTTIAKLNALAKPASPTSRIAPVEDTVYEITATLTAYKIEPDNDYHLALKNKVGTTMIAEIPAPGCVNGGPFRAAISASRKAFDARFKATSSYKTANVSVTIDGVGFFDKIHNQRGVAKNGIELHPVLSIVFN